MIFGVTGSCISGMQIESSVHISFKNRCASEKRAKELHSFFWRTEKALKIERNLYLPGLLHVFCFTRIEKLRKRRIIRPVPHGGLDGLRFCPFLEASRRQKKTLKRERIRSLPSQGLGGVTRYSIIGLFDAFDYARSASSFSLKEKWKFDREEKWEMRGHSMLWPCDRPIITFEAKNSK